MTFWDWLASPDGIRVEHAVIVLVLAISGYLSYLTKRATEKNRQLLNSHLEQHVLEAVEKQSDH